MTSKALQRILIFLVGGILTFPTVGSSELGLLLTRFISAGVAALIVYEIMLRTKRWLRFYTLPIYWLLARAIGDLANRLGSLLVFSLEMGASPNLERMLSGLWWLEPYSWEFWFTNPGWQRAIQVELIQSALLVLFAFILLKLPDAAASERSKRAPESAGLSEGYGGVAMSSTKSQTTRFLLASAFLLGSSFRTRILNYLAEKNRAVAPEPGLDLELIARVCKFIEDRDVGYQLLFVGLGAVAIVVALLGAVLPAAIGFVLGAWILQGYKSFQERHRSLAYFAKDRYDPATVVQRFSVKLDAETSEGIPKNGQNVLVYKGFSPFVGAGLDLGGWSFAVDLSRPREHLGQELEPLWFEVLDLYGAIEDAADSLGFDGLVISDYLFVNGVDIRDDRHILPDQFGRPVQVVTPELMAHYVTNSDSRIRHYKWLRIHDWGSELIVSHYLRCARKGDNLFVEMNRYLLTPLDTEYRRIDTLVSRTRWDAVKLGLGALIVGPFAALAAWLKLLAVIGDRVGRVLDFQKRRQRREIKKNPLFDYGVSQSLRESMSSHRFVHYFQRLDREMYVKILEREILDTIITFLEDHNIDTSDLRERQTTISNSGIIVQGGDIAAQSLAVGAEARATYTVQQAPKSEGTRRAAKES